MKIPGENGEKRRENIIWESDNVGKQVENEDKHDENNVITT